MVLFFVILVTFKLVIFYSAAAHTHASQPLAPSKLLLSLSLDAEQKQRSLALRHSGSRTSRRTGTHLAQG